MEKLIEKGREYSDKTILEALECMKGRNRPEEIRMARAALIEVWAERHGDAAADELMDKLGM